MKPWYLYTSEDDEHLYDEDFDLEALLSPSPAGGIQEPEPKETQEVSPIIQAPSSPEESLLVQQLHEQLQRERAKLHHQVELNKAQEQRLKSEERRAEDTASELRQVKLMLQSTELNLEGQTKAYKDVRYLYNTAVTDKANLRQELASAHNSVRRLKKQLEDQDKTVLEQAQKSHADVLVSELKVVKLELQTTNVKLQEQTKAYGEVRYLYNTAVTDKANLRQELASAKNSIARLKNKLEDQDRAIHELQTQDTAVPKISVREFDSGRATTRSSEQHRETLSIQTALETATKEKDELHQKVKELTSRLYASQEEICSLKIEKEGLKKALKKSEDQCGRQLQRQPNVKGKEQRRVPRWCQQ